MEYTMDNILNVKLSKIQKEFLYKNNY